MSTYSLSHLSDSILSRDLAAVVSRHRGVTAELLAHLAEFDERKLYLPAAYPSMFAYCVEELRFSEDEACRRIQVARLGRQFPAVFPMIAAGRLHLSAVLQLSTYLTPANAAELLELAAGKRKAQVEQLIAGRFPSTEPLPMVVPTPVVPMQTCDLSAPARITSNVPETYSAPEMTSCVKPIAAQRYEYHLSLGQEPHDDFEYARALLRHAVPSGAREEILARALKLLVREAEKRQFGATSRHRSPRGHASANPRHIPTRVKHAVWERDQGQCTFVSDSGHRCNAREFLEWDHIEPVACGGGSNVENLRLRCRAHNQFEAERTFGADFMRQKRGRARAGETARSEVAAMEWPPPQTAPSDREDDAASAAAAARSAAVEEMIPYLRSLRLSAADARRLAMECGASPEAPLEERLRIALKYYGSGLRSVRSSSGASASITAPAA